MAEFGAVMCSREGCSRHDFLPFVCAACGGIFCLDHRSIRAHDCEKGEAFLPPETDSGPNSVIAGGTGPSQRASHPLSQRKPSEIMGDVVSRFHGREGELNADVTHYNIKAKATGARNGAPDKLLIRAQEKAKKSSTERDKRVSAQVHRMLLKSKAFGDNKLKMSDRFFLEVHYCRNEEATHHMFFSRLWTVGRALDRIVELHRDCLRLEPGEENCALGLIQEGSPECLPLGGALCWYPPRVKEAAPSPASRDGAGREGSGGSGGLSHATSDNPGDACGPRVTGAVHELAGTHTGEGGEGGKALRKSGLEEGVLAGAGAAALGSAPNVDGVVEATYHANNASHINIKVVGHGKAVHVVGGIDLDKCSVLDLKRRLESLTGVPFLKQKLVFKGVLKDGDLMRQTKVVDGVKIMLLGARVSGGR
ncbi:unnamed protein product [Discosporangium mesarthrocarpum]